MDKVSTRNIALCFFLCVVFNNVSGQPSTSPQLASNTANNNSRIVGGEQSSTIRVAPYMALLTIRRRGEFRCGGSIVAERWILTAAHCVMGSTMTHIRVGSPLADSGGTTHMSNIYMLEPRYDPMTYEFDAALIFIERGLGLDDADKRAVSLASDNLILEPEDILQVSGFGKTRENGTYSNRLKFAEIAIVSNEDCQRAYDDMTITEDMVCLGERRGRRDVCEGDYGGPAVRDALDLLYGIASFGKGCGRPGVPSVYTRVTSVRDWVLQVIKRMP